MHVCLPACVTAACPPAYMYVGRWVGLGRQVCAYACECVGVLYITIPCPCVCAYTCWYTLHTSVAMSVHSHASVHGSDTWYLLGSLVAFTPKPTRACSHLCSPRILGPSPKIRSHEPRSLEPAFGCELVVAFPLQWPKLPAAIQDRHGDHTPDIPGSGAGIGSWGKELT